MLKIFNRFLFGVGGPNYTYAFHVIGEVFDRIYPQASITSVPLTNVQTMNDIYRPRAAN